MKLLNEQKEEQLVQMRRTIKSNQISDLELENEGYLEELQITFRKVVEHQASI